MPLTPEDVSNKRFTPVRLREGYDMGEVDQFLDEVEAELARLTQENEDLRSRLAAAASGAPVEPGAAPVAAPAAAPVAAPVEAVETIRVETAAQASTAAARLLEIATRNADELLSEAKEEAETIVGDARTSADRLQADSQRAADQVEADARSRAQLLDAETAERRQQLLGDLERERDKLTGEVEGLRSFEREYRSRLRSYFVQQLDALDNAEESAAPDNGDSHAPRRLRSILGEDQSENGGDKREDG